ncbi:glycerophosphodiester phosphodiesterase [Mobilitalea sibirica]|uniref:Glycerophosphodiester phosphodiesterase n=2 Tax=Mobilitalea sibirica TaxID=1462919 RepID=A0A8J7KWE3_9FIRM|nr:glycerophosphodiester phosphodiesterase [Mobilitalea sibirica]
MPKLRRNPDLKKLDGWYYAHRGLHDNQSDAPENSIRAFELAVNHRFGIELDVQLTKDIIPVVFHDYNLKRTCGVDKKVSELTYEELKQYCLFGSEQRIPTFSEALSCIAGKVPIVVELKIPWNAKSICEVVSKELDNYIGFYCIESFNPFGLMWYKKHYPKIVRGQLATDFSKEKIEGSKVQYFILKHLLFNFQTKPDFIAYHHVYKTGLSFTICRKLYQTKAVAWTIKSQKQLDECREYYDLFIFEQFLPEDKEN